MRLEKWPLVCQWSVMIAHWSFKHIGSTQRCTDANRQTNSAICLPVCRGRNPLLCVSHVSGKSVRPMAGVFPKVHALSDNRPALSRLRMSASDPSPAQRSAPACTSTQCDADHCCAVAFMGSCSSIAVLSGTSSPAFYEKAMAIQRQTGHADRRRCNRILATPQRSLSAI